MAKIHRGATLAPHFRDFLPPWVARQPWYRGSGTPTLSPVGYFRFEDPAGDVGVETHLVTDGAVLYQVPMTYRGAPLAGASDALITTAEHSVLGTRWIYDGEHDPVWRSELLRLVRTNAVSDPSGKSGVGSAEARGHCYAATDTTDDVRIELMRTVRPGQCPTGPGIAGVVTGTWHPDGPGTAPESGCLAVVRTAARP
ncbi:MAG: 1,4-alpha-glucan branching protein [Actinophytocola sp.]|nr:1,4-alpha-glucan branching protein [Actinophytocola sp.]